METGSLDSGLNHGDLAGFSLLLVSLHALQLGVQVGDLLPADTLTLQGLLFTPLQKASQQQGDWGWGPSMLAALVLQWE